MVILSTVNIITLEIGKFKNGKKLVFPYTLF